MVGVIRERIKNLAEILNKHQEVIKAGGFVSLEGLEEDAANICDEIAKLPVEYAREFAEDVEMLVNKIGEITAMLQDQQRDIEFSLEESNKRNFGQRAYVQASHLLPTKK